MTGDVLAREGNEWVLMAGSAYHFLPPHTCYNQREGEVRQICVWMCVSVREREREELFVFSGEQMAEKRSK